MSIAGSKKSEKCMETPMSILSKVHMLIDRI